MDHDGPAPLMLVLIHPIEVDDWITHGLPQAGVHVVERIGGPTIPIQEWVKGVRE